MRLPQLGILAFGVFLSGCLTDDDRQAVDAWLLCDECSQGELQHVVDRGGRFLFGRPVVNALASALRGPDRDQMDMKRAHFTASFAELSAHAASTGQPLTTTRNQYVNRLLGNYEASYQKRAAVALGEIGTARTTDILTRGLRRDSMGLAGYRSDVVTAIHRALYNASGSVLWKMVSAGAAHTCGLATSGDTYCWGRNANGQLGDLSVVERATPTLVAGRLNGVVVTAGDAHSCVTTESGDGFCWGRGTEGQLGDGTTSDRSGPERVALSLAPGQTSIAADSTHTCARSGFTVYCWGDNSFGQIGDGTNIDRPTPAEVLGFAFGSVTVGGAHTCSDSLGAGVAYCWGANTFGQLGDGTFNAHAEPEPVAGGLTVAMITAGVGHTCATIPSGQAYCWGLNSSGQLGDGTTTNSPDPAVVSGGHSFRYLTAGYAHTCGITSGGDALCWGSNSSGQLGDGSTVDRSTPEIVVGGRTFISLTTGGAHTCGITTDALLYCWGSGSAGQLGDGASTDRLQPVPVSGPPVP